MDQFNLPNVEDFRKNGKFYKLQLKKSDNSLPNDLYRFVFPDYSQHVFNKKIRPSKKTISVIKSYCISLKKDVAKEEKLQIQKMLKDAETKHLEEKIREYFDNYYKNLYCNQNSTNKQT